jgi:monoamine oxidase
MTITRRRFVGASFGLATLSLTPPRAFAALPREADVIVIGAGAAGIAAARRVIAANRRVVIVEAADRIGGRCVTDAATFGIPFDRGANWLHSAASNPVAKLARGAGMELYPAPRGPRIRIGRRNARPAETEDLLAHLVRANRAISEAGRGRTDLAALDTLPKDLGEWARTVEFTLGASATSKDLKDISAMDLARMEPRDQPSFCRQGVGALIAKLGEGLPVSLSTPVNKIEWSSRDAEVYTSAGKIVGRAAIVTASTGVLASGKIRFEPDLGRRQLDAAAKLGLGHYERIVLEFSGNPLNLQRDDVVIEQSDGVRTAMLTANINGSSLCAVDVAGSFARELAGRGEAAMTAFATEWLAKLYGSEIRTQIQRTATTNWGASPYVLGAMSGAAVGAAGARKALMENAGNLFFAGEAAHETLWGTVAGAWESGERAAESALRRIGALRDPAEAQPRKTPRKKKRAAPPAAAAPQ